MKEKFVRVYNVDAPNDEHQYVEIDNRQAWQSKYRNYVIYREVNMKIIEYQSIIMIITAHVYDTTCFTGGGLGKKSTEVRNSQPCLKQKHW